MSVIKKISDLTTVAIGYFTAPTGPIHPVNTMLSAGMPSVSQGVIDEVAKAIAGLAIAVVSRWIFSWFEKKKKVELVAGPNVADTLPVPPTLPDTITLNKNSEDEKEISK